jgi:biotin transport system substrate-specific component
MVATVFSSSAKGSQLSILHQITLAVAGSLLIAIASKVQVPFYPVPMTLQTLMVLTIGMAYGWRLAIATLVLYLLEGAVGLPVFAGTPEKGIGLSYMLGGTGGYLIGFVIAAGCCGLLAERGWDRSPLTTAATMLIGNGLIYVPGLLWLGSLYGWDKPILEWGLIPFLFGDMIKIVLASCMMPIIWRFLKKL